MTSPIRARSGKTTSSLNRSLKLSALLLLVCACLSAHAQTNEWTWMGGSNVVGSQGGQPGVYGTQGVFAPGNIPGSRYGATTWTDSTGNLWLYGGDGLNSAGETGSLNDLWEFNPLINQWAWIGNGPDALQNAASWTDSSGRLWLFGGAELYSSGSLYFNALQEFDPSTGKWTPAGPALVNGGENEYGFYGVMGIPGAENVPGSRYGSTSWTDSNGRLWLFGGYGYAAVGDVSYLNDLWVFDPSTNQWTWMSGSSRLPCASCAQPGVYGTLGTAAPGNVPGGRSSASSWIDGNGRLWLFGGYGDDAAGHDGQLNDLWQFNPTTGEWTWISGSNTIKQPGVYGTLRKAASGNLPGGRESAASWIDTNGDLWLLGGSGFDSVAAAGDLNDLWQFNLSSNQWTWMGGGSKVGSKGGQPGVYGTLAIPAAGNTPGGRNSAATWTDSSGHFWLFGGNGFDSKGLSGNLNDLWRYEPVAQTPTTTTIASTPNPSSFNQSVTFTATVTSAEGAPMDGEIVQFLNGTTLLGASTLSDGVATFSANYLGVGKNPITAEYTGDKTFAVSTSAALGQVVARTATSTTLTSKPNSTSYGELVTFSVQVTPQFNSLLAATGTVTFMNGSETLGTALLNGFEQATFTYTALPQGTDSITAVYGGDSNYLGSTSTAVKRVVSAEVTGDWTLMSESGNSGAPVYGTLGVSAVGNGPGNRTSASSWTSSNGQLWLFGGGDDGESFNDLWQFNPATDEWTWISGSSTPNQSGVYGTLGKAAAANVPGARAGASSWSDTGGNLWLFGGSGGGKGINCVGTYLSELWEFSISTKQWTWIGGGNTSPNSGGGCAGIYGKQGTAAAGNLPGARNYAASATDSQGHFWLFGGIGVDATDNEGYLNDLWEFDPSTKQWTWVSGASAVGQSGVYGSLGKPASANVPGARYGGTLWIDSGGHLWLFGGNFYNNSGVGAAFNDLWEFNPSTKQWMWVGGSSTANQSGAYGTLGAAKSGNVPGARFGASSWIDSGGHFLLFGGYGYDKSGGNGDLNDFWQFNPATNEWTWIGGTAASNNPGGYGTLGVSAAANLPGGRSFATSWNDSGGQLWLFGGSGLYATYSDLWQYQIPAATPAAAPTFSALAGTYTAPLKISILETTPGAAIHYTTNGTSPTANSASYSGPIEVTQAATVKAVAIAPGRPSSALATAIYTILKPQTIAFTPPAAQVTYGVKPVTLSAKATSGLSVTFKVVSGPAKIIGSTLTVAGAGTVVLAANQPGNSDYAPAKQVEVKLTVEKARLTVTANNLTMKQSAAVPTLTYKIAGFVDGDTQAKASTGKPTLSTTATSKSNPGSYPITIKAGTLAAPNYTFTFVNGALTVIKQ